MPAVHHHIWYPGSRLFAVVSSRYCVRKKHWILSSVLTPRLTHPGTSAFAIPQKKNGTGESGAGGECACALLAGKLRREATVFATLFLKSIWFSKNSNSLRHMSLVSVFSVWKQEARAWSPQLLCWDGTVGGVLTVGEGVQIPDWLPTSLLLGSTSFHTWPIYPGARVNL